ncbi:GNAT family N-acetyltransferase [Streptomyces sp. NPDC047049]|uniref:GNAT family N-acetyltransferase n=1 Tax=Streptomyces sp. NPDC047049 TaxID=3156688 RepID=UPI0033C17786
MEHCVTTAHVALRHYTHSDLAEIRQTLLDVHADAYGDRMTEDFVQRFPWFVDHWGGKPGFFCVIAYDADEEAIGFTYGAPAEAGREWWRDYVDPAPTDTSTFAVSELMLRVKWRGHGLGQQLHDALLGARNEALAVLTVDTKRPKLQALYESWGYRKVGEQQPFPDSPVYAVMMFDLKAGI